MRTGQTVQRSPVGNDTTSSVGGITEPAAPGTRSVDLPRGRTLLVRPAGPHDLDGLVEIAASNGVPNLEADILQMNRPMLALVRSRGYATVPSDDFTVVRVLIGAAGRMPTWPAPHDRLRVLVEGSGDRWRHDHHATDAAGLHVLTCPGPTVQSRRCPVLAGRPCPLSAGADVIVVGHPSDDDLWRTVRSAHARLHPGVPVCVELARDGSSAVAAASEQVLRSTDDVLSVVERVARHRMADVTPRPGT